MEPQSSNPVPVEPDSSSSSQEQSPLSLAAVAYTRWGALVAVAAMVPVSIATVLALRALLTPGMEAEVRETARWVLGACGLVTTAIGAPTSFGKIVSAAKSLAPWDRK